MKDTLYLGGRVIHQTLPLLTDGAAPDAPVRKRLHLPQGDLIQIHNGPEPLQYLAWIELKADGVRGHHVHRVKKEFLYLLSGAAIVKVEDPATRETATVPLAAGDLVIIEPGIAHAIHSATAGAAIEFSPAPFDPADTVRYPVTG